MSFKDSEFKCKCGCGLGIDDFRPMSIERIKRARKIADVPFIIKSAMRCKKHNEIIDGSENSAHLRGAFDIKVTNSKDRYKVITALLIVGFTRIGIAKTFIHADDDHTLPSSVVWLY